MDKIDKLIEQIGEKYKGYSNNFNIISLNGEYFVAKYGCVAGDYVCSMVEYKERLAKQNMIKLIESACTNDAASIANVIIRNGWVKK